ncbi:MAG: hypothetical protein ABI769_10060 [Pseudomonadota bacterium]
MKALKIAGKVLLGLLLLVMLLYLVGLSINWSDRPPTTEARRLEAVLLERPAVPDSENAFVYAMGFAVAEGADPQVLGSRRIAWLEEVNHDSRKINSDPVRNELDFKPTEAAATRALRASCIEEQSIDCRNAFEAAAVAPRSANQKLQLARYQELLRRTRWRELVPIDLSAPIARYADILGGQRLLLADLRSRADTAGAAEVRAGLRADVVLWREIQKSSDNLITKMIAITALRQHLFFGNLVLRQLPADQQLAAIPDEWNTEFTVAELSMLRTMAGELAFSRNLMRQWYEGMDSRLDLFSDDGSYTPKGPLASKLARPFYQPQDQSNYFATQYLAFATSFNVPLDQYSKAADQVAAMQSAKNSPLQLYNLTGWLFRQQAGAWDYSNYPMRVGAIEGMRRAAVLTAQLRARNVPKEKVAEALIGAELRNPFDHTQFEWSSDEEAVIYQGPRAEGGRRRHVYFY